jgi:hypothetical protein
VDSHQLVVSQPMFLHIDSYLQLTSLVFAFVSFFKYLISTINFVSFVTSVHCSSCCWLGNIFTFSATFAVIGHFYRVGCLPLLIPSYLCVTKNVAPFGFQLCFRISLFFCSLCSQQDSIFASARKTF